MSETSQTSSENEKSKTNRPPRKRQVHNEVERRRKYKINNWISKISELLPNKELHKKSKICILEQTVDYIKELVVERDKLLSEQCSDVQLEEVKKLKKELNLIEEQNRVYVKLLQQANISISSLPKKATKYSNKFTEQNGLQLLQQAEQAEQHHSSSPPQEQRASQVCSSIQDSIGTSVALTAASACNQISQTALSSSVAVLSTSVREHNNRTTTTAAQSCASAQSTSTVPALPTCIVCTNTPVPSASAFINSQGTIPSYTSGSVFSAKTTVSAGSGGVTPALSPFPLMSTTLSSSVSDIYSKSVRMILMPSTPIPTERVTLSNLNIASSLVHTLPISVPKTVANHCIISPLNYGNTLNVLPESALISNGVQISTDPLPNNAVCINVANGFLNSGFIIAAPVVSSTGNSSPCVKIPAQTNAHSNVSEVVSTLPVACENLQSVVPPAVPLSRENSILSNSTASQIGVTSVPQNEGCAKVMQQPTVSNAHSDSSSKSHGLMTESLLALSTKTSNSNASSSSATHSLPDVRMEMMSHPNGQHPAAEPCSNVISENNLAQSENSLNFVPLSSKSSEHETNTEVVPLTSPLPLKVLCTKKIVLFSRQHQNATDLSHLSFPNISSSVIHDEVIHFQSNETVPSATCGSPSLSEDISRSNKVSPPATSSHIHCVPATVNVSGNISLKSHELFSPSLHSSKTTEACPDVGGDLAPLSSSSKSHNIPTCSSVINDSSNTVFVLSSSNVLEDKVAEPQKVVSGSKRSVDSSAVPHNTKAYQDSGNSGRGKMSSLHENATNGILPDTSSTLSVQPNPSPRDCSPLPKAATVELGFKNTDIVTSKCTNPMVLSAIPPVDVNATKMLTEDSHTSKSTSTSESGKSIPFSVGLKSSQSDNGASSLYSPDELNSGQPLKRTESEKNSIQVSESNLSALPSVFHNSQFFNPTCINIQPASSGINIPLAPTLGNNNKPNPDKSAVISATNLSLSSIGFSALLPTHNVIPLMATPSVSSLTVPSYCVGPNDKSCSNLLGDKAGTMSFPVILSGYSDCDVIENKSIFPNVDANFSINFLNANFPSTAQKPQHQLSCSSKKRNKSVTKKAKCISDNKTKGCSSSDSMVNCSSKYQVLASSDVESIELHKASLDQSSLFLSNDILAKATESIFCNSILDGGQGAAECQEEIMNSVSEQSPPIDSGNSSNTSSEIVTNDASKLSESSKKNPSTNVSSAENVKSVCNHNSKTSEMVSSENLEKEIGNDVKEKTMSRARKSSAVEDDEPLPKRAKGEINKTKDSTPTQSIRQTEFYVTKLVAQETNPVKDREETFGSLVSVSRENTLLTVNAKDSENLHSTCNNSKSLSPSESAFPNTTPSIGEILKDVSHGMIHFNPRNNVSSQGEGPGLLPVEKSVPTESSVRNASDEFLQLPQNYFPATSNVAMPQLSSASEMPLCQSVNPQTNESCKTVTNSVSSSQQDNQKKGGEPSQWTEKNDNDGILSYSNVLKEKDPKHSCSTQSSLQPSSDSNGTATFLYPEASNIIPTIPTSEIIPVSPSKSMSNQFGVQNVCASVAAPVIPPNIHFNRVSSQVQQSFLLASPPPLLSRNYGCQSSSQAIPFASRSSENQSSSQSPAVSSESLSHSLCSLLKDTSSQLSNIPTKNVVNNKNTMQTSTTAYSSTSSTSVSHSKYSALSLISHQTFSGSSSGISTSLSLLQPSVMTAPSCQQMSNTPVTTHSVCNRNTRASLSYSAENLIHSQGMEVDKDKSKTIISGSYFPHKKGEQDLVQSIHDVGDSNIFMPLGSSEINSQSMSMVPLPPVTSFPSFPSNYSMCDAGPPVSLRCSGTMDRTQDLSLQLQPNESSFLRHAGMNEPSTPSHSDRHIAHSSNMTSVTKPHSNLSLSFESHGSFYNNCNFLQHPKPNLDNPAVPDNNPCFQATSFNSGYAQSIQKQNCCHFSHQAVASHSGLIADTSLPIITSVGPFHAEKNDSLMNRPSLENNSSQSCSNYIGNIFYDSSCNRQVVGTKPSSMNLSQELYSPLGVRQNTHHSAPSSGNMQNQRKNIASGKTKSKKVKQASVSESSINTNAAASSNSTSNVNFFSVPEISCSKSNIPPVPNCYFKNSHQTPASLQPANEKNKLSENILSSSIPPNPPFNPILHPQNDGLLNLNFQPPNFGMSSLSRPPPPLCCSCITSPVITQTFTTAATHPVPNFNLSNILPDMGCSSSESVTLSPIKFHPPSHMLPAPPPPPSVPSQCQGDSSQVGSGHALSRQGSGPSLYPPHPPVIHNTFSPLLNHASHGLNRNHAPMSGTGTSCTAPQGATFVPTQPPPFRNVIQSLNFTRSDR